MTASLTEVMNKYVRLRGRTYVHTYTYRSYVHTPRDFTNGSSLALRVARALTELLIEHRSDVSQPRPVGYAKLLPVLFIARRPILGFSGSKVPKMCHSLPWTPMNRLAKYDAASCIFGGLIHNRTNKQTNKHTHTHTQNKQ